MASDDAPMRLLDLVLRSTASSVLGAALLTLVAPPPPTVVSLTPDSAAGVAGLTLTIEGSGFEADRSVPEVFHADGRLVATGTVTLRTPTRMVATLALAGASPGTYTVKVLNPGGARSMGVALTLVPEVAVTPRQGRAGQSYTYRGRGFTKGFGVTSYLKRPDGLEFQARRIATSAEGTFDEAILSGEFAPGMYTAWAVDDYTKVKARPATFEVVGGAISVR
jgi:hypothetical protein